MAVFCGVVKVGVEVEDDGCVSSLHSGSFNKVGVVGESIGVLSRWLTCPC